MHSEPKVVNISCIVFLQNAKRCHSSHGVRRPSFLLFQHVHFRASHSEIPKLRPCPLFRKCISWWGKKEVERRVGRKIICRPKNYEKIRATFVPVVNRVPLSQLLPFPSNGDDAQEMPQKLKRVGHLAWAQKLSVENFVFSAAV